MTNFKKVSAYDDDIRVSYSNGTGAETKNLDVISPQEFKHVMKITKRRYKDDPEECHMHMDSIMGTMLEDLGYGEGVKVFDSVMKWYS